MRPSYDYLIAGAGFAGAVLAERLARRGGKKVLVVDRREHVAGNAFDERNAAGILVHRYGPHLFHTNAERVWNYLSPFTAWRPYEYRILTSVDGRLLPFPINVDTINRLYGLELDTAGLERFFENVREPLRQIRTSEDVVVSRIGRELYEKFYRGYTRKQWDLDPSELDASVCARVAPRTNHDDRYFTDRWQAIPVHGYTEMFKALLDHPNITVELGADAREIRERVSFRELIWTGPIDEFFGHALGPLPYRSVRFEFATHDVEQWQSAACVHFPNEHAYTRVTEFKYITGQTHAKTTVAYEFPSADGEPAYPIPQPEARALYQRYLEMAGKVHGVHFVGRLATYRYYNMDQVIAQALTLADSLLGLREQASPRWAPATAGALSAVPEPRAATN